MLDADPKGIQARKLAATSLQLDLRRFDFRCPSALHCRRDDAARRVARPAVVLKPTHDCPSRLKFSALAMTAPDRAVDFFALLDMARTPRSRAMAARSSVTVISADSVPSSAHVVDVRPGDISRVILFVARRLIRSLNV
jgi:hypothetical protein